MLTRRKRTETEPQRPGKLTEPELLQRLDRVEADLVAVFPDKPSRAAMPQIIAEAEALAAERDDLLVEIGARRCVPREQSLRQASRAPATTAGGALALVARAAHPECEGERLNASLLSEQEGKELLALAKRRLDGREPLGDEEQLRYEHLVGQAAGNERLFEDKRARAQAREKIAEFRAEERRHPQSEDLVAAVMGDPTLFDYMHAKIRDVELIDDYGAVTTGTTSEALLEPENISSLFVIVSALAANGGHPIEISLHGKPGEGLPFVPPATLSQLRRNGWLRVERVGPGFKISVGSRIRALATRWGLALPPPEEDEPAS